MLFWIYPLKIAQGAKLASASLCIHPPTTMKTNACISRQAPMSWIPDYLRTFQNTQSIVIYKLGYCLLNTPKLIENIYRYFDRSPLCLCPSKERK